MRPLRDMVAEAIRADGTDLCDRPWSQLPPDIKAGWLADADRAINCIISNVSASPTVELVQDADGAQSLHLNGRRIAGFQPIGGSSVINKWCVRRADLVAALGIRGRQRHTKASRQAHPQAGRGEVR